MNTTQTDTPETDKVRDGLRGRPTIIAWNYVLHHARKLERERDAALRELAKMKQYALLQKINAGGEVDFTAEDITLIKERAGKLYPILIFGRMTDMLEKD